MSLELKNVEKKVGIETHIHSTNLKLEKNTINILLGSTLAGKTTLMQIMAGLDKPTSGEIWFNGENVTGKEVQKRNCSMVYQQFINYPNFTVFENIASPLKITGIKSDEIKERVGKVAELLKLSGMLNKKPDELSGGQQQRTALARALVKDSDLILLDEPLANLDFKLREELREELPKLFEDRDCIVVYATTEPQDALMIGGNTATLLEGKVMQYGKTLDVYNKPQNLTSARVTGNRGNVGNSTRGILMAGYNHPARVNVIDYITIASIGNATDFGDTTQIISKNGGASNSTRGFSASGLSSSPTNKQNTIE